MKAFVAVSAAFVTYFVLSTFFGPVGVQAYRQLGAYQQELSENVASLEQTGRELQAEADAYRSNAERIAAEARSVGYFREDSGLVRVEGFTPERRSIVAGRLMERRPVAENHLPLLRWISIGVGLLLYLVLTLTRRES